MASCPVVSSYIQKGDGSQTMNCQETLEMLIYTHFASYSLLSPQEINCLSELGTVLIPLGYDWLNLAIRSFTSFKSPDLDKADLQKKCGPTNSVAVRYLYGMIKIFVRSHTLGYVHFSFHPKGDGLREGG